jgi:hypothetical protein
MSTHPEESPEAPVPLWRARAWLHGGNWTDAAYGFGAPDVAEAAGSAAQIGAELTGFLNSLEVESVPAELADSGHFAVRLESEPHDGGAGVPAGQDGADSAEHCVPRWEAEAAVGNSQGVFDACYEFGSSYGDGGHLIGTAQEVGVELARVLQVLTRGDVEVMKYGTDRFFVELAR